MSSVLPVTLSMTDEQRHVLLTHLFPDDGCEAIAFALCGRARSQARHRLLVRQLELIPYASCSVRLPDRVTWPTEVLVPLLTKCAKNGWAIVKIHGHRGYARFSEVDDESDKSLFPSIYSWADSDEPHGSAILMDDGSIFGRVVTDEGDFRPFDGVSVIGDEIRIYPGSKSQTAVPEHARRIAQTFGSATFEQLRGLRVAVIGCSGTGSPVIEQLARNCVGTLVLVDPDFVENKNLNRIINSTMDDAIAHRPKVEVFDRAVRAMGLGTEVVCHHSSLFSEVVVRDVAACDVVFGCMDTIDGRFFLNKLCSFYLLPYFDLGVKIEADGQGGVDQVCGSVHYVQPGGSSLLSRNVFTLEQVRSAGLQRTDPDQYKSLLAEGYIRGIQEDNPAVIQLNMLIASFAINEFLARLHPYRLDPNSDYAINRISLSHGIFDREEDGLPCAILSRHVGRGDVEPLLEWAELSLRN